MILIELLTAPGCAYCETAKTRVADFAQKARNDFPDLAVRVIDIAAHPEIRFKYGIYSTPAIAINGQLEIIGVPKEDDLKSRILKVSGKSQ